MGDLNRGGSGRGELMISNVCDLISGLEISIGRAVFGHIINITIII